LWAKLGLYRRAAQDRGIVYVHPEKSQPSIYGVFSENESGWQVSFSGSSWSVGDRVETVLLPSTSSIFVRNSQSLQGIQGFPWPASVKTVLEGPLQELWSAPGSFTAFAGDINMFAENPFQDDLRWENARTVESSAATAILTSLLESLMVRYPMAFERVLPDNSKVFELKKGADQFLLPETSVDVIIHPQGVMTYPHDQLRYEFGDGTLLIRKGDDASNQNETMELSCGLADPKLEILVSGDFIDTSLWTRTFFALNKRNGVVCIFW
jgi:hypothetical protein